MSFKIVTYNVNSIRSRLDALSQLIEEEKPDVIALQETKVTDDKFPVDFFEERKYQIAFRGEKSYNGVALISKFPIEDVHVGMDGWENPGEARLIAGTIQGIRIVNSYVPQGREVNTEPWIYKLGWLKEMRNYWNRYGNPEQPWIWLGDLNVAPGDHDVHNPVRLNGAVGFHPEERKIMTDLMAWGWEDVFRKYRTGPDEFTFWDYRAIGGLEKNLGWRIDHIWATHSLAECSVDSYVLRQYRGYERPSDHAPLVAVFDWPRAGVKSMVSLKNLLIENEQKEEQASLFGE